jgi:hypothetical protein
MNTNTFFRSFFRLSALVSIAAFSAIPVPVL